MMKSQLKISLLAAFSFLILLTSCSKEEINVSDFTDETLLLVETETRSGKFHYKIENINLFPIIHTTFTGNNDDDNNIFIVHVTREILNSTVLRQLTVIVWQ